MNTNLSTASLNTTALTFEIVDPSGETRFYPLPRTGEVQISRSLLSGGLLLRDPTLPEWIGVLDCNSELPWLRLSSSGPGATLAAIPVRDAMIPLELPLRIGETTLKLRRGDARPTLPVFPRVAQVWKTACASGASLLWMTKKAAATPLSIYIAGETGTGKEVIASLLHAWSERAGAPFIPLHCGALAPSLAESELFGHVKGAYTGAHNHRVGALLAAHGGTLFLDEVGDLSLDLQVKLLRFLENGEVRPVGSDQIRHSDVRVVCATHMPLRKLVEEGKFRRDLYYRLASVTLEIPTLRSRSEDIELLAREFAAGLAKSISPRALLRLQAYSWPGNVRELRHAVERAAGLSGSFQPMLDEESFAFLFAGQSEESSEGFISEELAQGMLTLGEMERVMILRSLKLTRGNRAEAAKILGVARSTLFEMLKRYRIEGPRAHLYSKKLLAEGRVTAA